MNEKSESSIYKAPTVCRPYTALDPGTDRKGGARGPRRGFLGSTHGSGHPVLPRCLRQGPTASR